MTAVCTLVVLLAACGSDADRDPTPSPSTATTSSPIATAQATPTSDRTEAGESPEGDLKFKVTGMCTSNGGTLRAIGSNFTPYQQYTTQVWYPNGDPYPSDLISNPGNVSANGTTPWWTWPCDLGANDVGDPPGKYEVLITEYVEGASARTVRTTFTIREP